VTPGGSSGGAVVAAVTGAGVLHIGTDGGGSIRIPSSLTGMVGLKPTFGRVAAYPPSAFGTVAHIGPIGRSAEDAAAMLAAMTGRDIDDWNQGVGELPPLELREGVLKGAQIGLWTKPPYGVVDLDSSLVANRMLTYRHQLVASPTYLSSHNPPKEPNDLHDHRLISFLYWNAQNTWTLVHKNGKDRQTVTFEPYLSMNDFHGLASVLVAGGGIGELPPVVQPALIREGRLVEVMPDWRFGTYDLSLVHLGSRHISKPCRLFKELARQMAPTLFPRLPT
jgi:Asp-tRNA(Asn)/Glu-tRNA(Gln) amidotransferase A subunit family amidase